MFRRIIVHAAAMELALEPLGLSLRIDSHRGVAFVALGPNATNSMENSEDEEWSHPLVRNNV